MTPTPSPTPVPVEVFLHTGPAEWWQILTALGPLAVLISALIAGIIGYNTLKQKAVADNRAEWWKRTQWALDAVYSGDKKQAAVGLLLLSDDRRAPEKLHYTYGALALGLALTPWFYAPGVGPKRLLWFAVTTLVAGALAVRAFMSGS